MSDYLIQCKRGTGELCGIVEWEDLFETEVWQTSPNQKYFFNFRCSQEQNDYLIEKLKTYDLTIDTVALSSTTIDGWATALENNTIVDIRDIPIWYSVVIETERPVEGVIE